MLTNVAFKLWVASSLPRCNYRTTVDTYILVSILIPAAFSFLVVGTYWWSLVRCGPGGACFRETNEWELSCLPRSLNRSCKLPISRNLCK